MTKLKVLDITNNPLACDEEFKNLMKMLGRNKVYIPFRRSQVKFFQYMCY